MSQAMTDATLCFTADAGRMATPICAPTSEITVDLEAEVVRGDGFAYKFQIDPFARECLLQGLDEITLVERHASDIGAYEAHRSAWLPAVK